MNSWLPKISLLALIIILPISFYIMYNGIGLIEGLDFGPGNYYYTDIPGWENIFFGKNNARIGTDHPLLFFTLFFGWGFICYKFLSWLDRKN